MVQEVFIRLMARSSGGAIDNPEGYIFQTAANLLRDRARLQQARRTDLHDSFEETEHSRVEISPERVLLSQEGVALLVRALFFLCYRTRRVLHSFPTRRSSD